MLTHLGAIWACGPSLGVQTSPTGFEMVQTQDLNASRNTTSSPDQSADTASLVHIMYYDFSLCFVLGIAYFLPASHEIVP